MDENVSCLVGGFFMRPVLKWSSRWRKECGNKREMPHEVSIFIFLCSQTLCLFVPVCRTCRSKSKECSPSSSSHCYSAASPLALEPECEARLLPLSSIRALSFLFWTEVLGRGFPLSAPSGNPGGARLLDPDFHLLISVVLVFTFLLGMKVLLLLLAGTKSGGYISL